MFCAIFIVVIKNVILQFYLKFYETPDTIFIIYKYFEYGI